MIVVLIGVMCLDLLGELVDVHTTGEQFLDLRCARSDVERRG